MTTSPITDLTAELQRLTTCEVRSDPVSRLLYSTDASIYQIEPLGVAFPHSGEDLAAIVELAARYEVPVLARGSGSSLAGQAIGPALIIDCSRYLDNIIEINKDARTAIVEPGVILAALNQRAALDGLQFGPDPASAERATIGGSVANNASGAHSIVYGMAADHISSSEVILADGSLSTWEEIDLSEAERRASGAATYGNSIYKAALTIRTQYAAEIYSRWPKVWRRASGYSLNYLLPWSSSQPPVWGGEAELAFTEASYPPIPSNKLNLAPLLAGSEGTLAVIRRLTLRLVPLPKYTVLGVLAYHSLVEACDAVPGLLERRPQAVELIPQSLITLARSVPAFAHQLSWLAPLAENGDPAALLVVEFAGGDFPRLLEQARALGSSVLIADSPAAQKQVWAVRKNGLGIMLGRTGDAKPLSFIEDLAVPVERLGDFVREMDRIIASHHTTSEIYAHASAGCLHIRPIISLKTLEGVQDLRSIAKQAVELTLRLGGSVSGEHGDGIARSEWLESMYGPDIIHTFRYLKQSADPQNILNPGKIIDAPPMDTNLRYGPDYKTNIWTTGIDFSHQDGLSGAVELCNGAGVCRKTDGLMCPSFQATQEEMHSTRGRANLLRAMISGRMPPGLQVEKAVYAALDLCLACKGCKAECPSAVDMAKLRYEFFNHYYQSHPRRSRDYLFGYIDVFGWLGHWFPRFANWLLNSSLSTWIGQNWLELAGDRRLPNLARRTLSAQIAGKSPNPIKTQNSNVLLLNDAFTEYFHPSAGLAAWKALSAAGFSVTLIPVLGAGRTLISKSFLEAGRRHALRLVEWINKYDPQGLIPVVGIEPSEIYTLRDEYPDLLPGDTRVVALASRSYMVDEFLIRPSEDGVMRLKKVLNSGALPRNTLPVYLHGHCYQKAQPPAQDGYLTGVPATVEMLNQAGYQVHLINSGCCGMAGAFGYEAEHYELSIKIANLSLFPAINTAPPEAIIAASGVSCQAQIVDGTRRKAIHPIELIA